VHGAKPPEIPAAQWEIARTGRFRDILENLIEESNKTALILQQEMRAEAASRQAAREAEAAAPPKPQPAAKPPNQDAPPAPPAPSRRHHPRHPDQIFKTLVQTIESCIRLDAWLADRLARGQTETAAEPAYLTHPNRPDLLAYLFTAARAALPNEDRSDLYRALEASVAFECTHFPDRAPGDTLAEFCDIYELPYNEADFPNNWRIETYLPFDRRPWHKQETEKPFHPRE
jgi:hypothetical protein